MPKNSAFRISLTYCVFFLGGWKMSYVFFFFWGGLEKRREKVGGFEFLLRKFFFFFFFFFFLKIILLSYLTRCFLGWFGLFLLGF